MPCGGGEAGDIAYHPSTKGDEYVIAAQAEVRQGAVDFIDEMEIPGFITGRHHNHLGLETRILQGTDKVRAVELIDTIFCDDGGL